MLTQLMRTSEQEPVPDLRYRSFFILGPTLPPEYESWLELDVGAARKLAVHPALDVTQIQVGKGSLTSLGFLLDPHSPEATDRDILEYLVANGHSFESIRERSNRLGGRWILIYENGPEAFLFHDTGGLRQVYYTHDKALGPVWCASQPRMIADALDLDIGAQAAEFIGHLNAYLQTKPTKPRGFWWPGAGSQYEEIKLLLPNHYLDLNSGAPRRFFPVMPNERLSREEAVDRAAPLLQGTMLSASNHFDELTLLITAGLDSRLMLAASRPIADRLSYLTIDYALGETKDVNVAAALLADLQLPHEVVPARRTPSEEFGRLYQERCILYNDYYAANAEALLPVLRCSSVAISGNSAGILTTHYRLPRIAATFRELTPELLTQMSPAMQDHPFATQEFGKWLDGLGETYNYHPLDLFYWEQRGATWLASWMAGYDLVARDHIVPLNSREILVLLLAADEDFRKRPYKGLNRALITKLWPEVPLYLEVDDVPTYQQARQALRKGWKKVKKSIKLTIP